MGVYKELEEQYDFDILDEFLDHFEMMGNILEPTIINLKDGHTSFKSGIEELFRIFHNLKSASGFLKLVFLNKLSAFTENVLEDARKLDGPASEEFINWLFLVSDQLNMWFINIKNDDPKFAKIDKNIFKLPMKLED